MNYAHPNVRSIERPSSGFGERQPWSTNHARFDQLTPQKIGVGISWNRSLSAC